jgi:hypothetical protein
VASEPHPLDRKRERVPSQFCALTAARKFRDDSKSFASLSLYKQRLQRALEK